MLHLDDPVTEVVRLARPSITHTLTDLPMGKYIVCGEAHEGGSDTPYQTSCFETRIERLETDSESTPWNNGNRDPKKVLIPTTTPDV